MLRLGNHFQKTYYFAMAEELQEGIDFIYDEKGLMILTRQYLLKRGRCCQSGCQNCPYGYANKANPDIPAELQSLHQEPDHLGPEIYDGEIPEDFR